ncbi:hypothetical protein [Marinobacter sp. LV10MA510-1]|uniref:hypothetical protein n=1 Tax=Marinobacter sp. LV10MA510-1 TaxID=1415567 RepID=UPI000BF40640|nr:hypothetical protein [Marinobacter sp. LV10MA510-1]PFG09110.1 hypothetical protein ATI45_1464 [Marinobacter sp. LV10MA510-1]
METLTLVLLLAAVVAIAITVVTISHLREKARIQRIRRIATLEENYKLADRLLTELPGQYLTSDLKLVLIKQMEHSCNGLATLNTALPIDKRRDALGQLKQQIRDGTDKTVPVRIESPQKATAVKDLLQSLFALLETMHKAGRLDAATARKNLKYVLFLVHKTHTDLHVFQARDYVRQNEIRKAIHAYHLASTEMGKSADNPVAMKAVKSFRTRIKELEALTGTETDSANLDAHRKHDKEWDTLLEDDSWKKKANYDD